MNGSTVAWLAGIAGAHTLIALGVSMHVVLKKRDDRAAAGWMTLVWLSPFVGATLYWMFGYNRITRRAIRLRGAQGAGKFSRWIAASTLSSGLAGASFRAYEANLVQRFHQAPWAGGNQVHPLRAGDTAFPDMLLAIGEAKASVALATYIFNDDTVGRRFVDALRDAQARGVQVRVLVDGIGALYSFPPIVWCLRRQGVRTERFLTSLLPWRMTYLNLRNHRKILVVDGRVGFIGGMNIKRAHVLAESTRWPTNDMQFRIEGPAVADLMTVFAADWAFTWGETLSGEPWHPPRSRRQEGPISAVSPADRMKRWVRFGARSWGC